MGSTTPSAPSAGAPPRPPAVLGWLRGYERAALPADVLAGLTAAAVVLPKAMAYAAVAGLPAQVGLYAAFVPPIVYALVGRSAVLSISTTTTIGILVGSALATAAPGVDPARLVGAAATLSMLVGVVLIAAGVLRLGFLATLISEPVLAGFKAGIGAVIVADQLPKLFGFHIQKAGFFRDLATMARASGETSVPTLALSVAAVVTILALKRWVPRVPAALVAVAASVAASAWLGLPSLGIRTIGAIPAGLPSLIPPELGLLGALWPAALAIALMSFTETAACSRAFAGPTEARPAPNVELLATGLGNLAGGLVGAMPSGGGTSQTLVNRRAGARTQLAGLVIGLAAVGTLLFLAPALSLMPEAALAAIVLVYSIELVSPRDFKAIAAVRRTELIWAITAFAGVLLLGTLRGILVAVITSLLALAYQASNPSVYEVVRKAGTNVFRRRSPEHPEDQSYPGLIMLRVEGRLFFANTDRVLDAMAALVWPARPEVIVLDCAAIFDVEYSALKMLAEADARVRSHGCELWLSALNPAVRRVVERAPLGLALGKERMCFDLEHAVARYQARAAKAG